MTNLLVSFTVDTNPLPKQRARVGNGHGYTPERTRQYESYVAMCASLAMQGLSAFDGDVELAVMCYREGKRRADLDNLVKAISDACNGIVYQDDKQIVSIEAVVNYGAKKNGGFTTVYVFKAANVWERMLQWIKEKVRL